MESGCTWTRSHGASVQHSGKHIFIFIQSECARFSWDTSQRGRRLCCNQFYTWWMRCLRWPNIPTKTSSFILFCNLLMSFCFRIYRIIIPTSTLMVKLIKGDKEKHVKYYKTALTDKMIILIVNALCGEGLPTAMTPMSSLLCVIELRVWNVHQRRWYLSAHLPAAGRSEQQSLVVCWTLSFALC